MRPNVLVISHLFPNGAQPGYGAFVLNRDAIAAGMERWRWERCAAEVRALYGQCIL